MSCGLWEEAVKDWRELGDAGKPHPPVSLVELSRLTGDQADEDYEYELAKEGMELYVALNDRSGQACTWRHLSDLALIRGDFESAQACINHAWEISEAMGSGFQSILSLRNRGDAGDELRRTSHVAWVRILNATLARNDNTRSSPENRRLTRQSSPCCAVGARCAMHRGHRA
jgi:hypothetical protein